MDDERPLDEHPLGRRLLAEAVGTALLVIFGAGVLVAALATGKGQLDYAGLGIVAFSFALVIASAIYMFGTTSGAHINPAVTVSLAVVRRFPWVEVPPYITAQILGAIGGALLVNAIFGSQASDLYVSGSTVVGDGFTHVDEAVRRAVTAGVTREAGAAGAPDTAEGGRGHPPRLLDNSPARVLNRRA